MNALVLIADRLRHHSRAGWLPLILLLAGCDVLGPAAPLPAEAVAFAVPAQFRDWWARTEACAGRTGRLAGINWYIVPGATQFLNDGDQQVGRWSRSGTESRIVLAGDFASDELVVRHEMLHAILDRGDHPSQYFVARCSLTWESWEG